MRPDDDDDDDAEIAASRDDEISARAVSFGYRVATPCDILFIYGRVENADRQLVGLLISIARRHVGVAYAIKLGLSTSVPLAICLETAK